MMMGLSNAERQRRFRQKYKGGLLRVNLPWEASSKLAELVAAMGKSKTEVISEAVATLWDKRLKPPPPIVRCQDCKHIFPATNRCFRLFKPALKEEHHCEFFEQKA